MSHYTHDIVAQFKQVNILLVGDIILDHYAFGVVERISPEAPIQILDVTREEYRLGGASNVANNFVALNALVSIVGVVGEDENGQQLHKIMQQQGIDTSGVVVDIDRPTTVKSRMIAHGDHLLRVDKEVRKYLSEEISNQLKMFVEEHIKKYDVVVISDYAKGVLSPYLCQSIIDTACQHNKPVIVGPKGNDWSLYKGATLISANRKETEAIVGFSLQTNDDIKKAGRLLLEKFDLKIAVITLGPQGIYAATKNEDDIYVKAEAQEVFDVTGAGDTVLSILSLCAGIDCSWKKSIILANTAAGIVVGKVGASTVTIQDLQTKTIDHEITYLRKLKSLSDIIIELEILRTKGKCIVFTNGCFDIMHPGHIRYLEYCRNRGDVLVVGLNSDHSITRLKGSSRPIMKESDRAEMLSALSFVDYVTIFTEDTPTNLIQKIKPDILVKGADWQGKEVAGANFIKSYGGSVEFYPYQEGYSTTNIVSKINEKSI